MKVETCFLAALIIVMAAAMVTAAGFPFWQAKIAPLTVGGAILVLAGVQLMRQRGAAAANGSKAGNENEQEAAAGFSGYVRESLWMVGFVAGIYFFGLLVSIPLFGTAYMKAHGGRFALAALISVLTALSCYIIFTCILGITLYPGIVFE